MKMTQLNDELVHFCRKMPDQYERLMEFGPLHAGKQYTKENVEYILGCKADKDSKFRWDFIYFQQFIEYKGFFSTGRGYDYGALRIIETAEMAEQGLEKLRKASRLNYRVKYVMSIHDSSGLGERERKIYDAVVNKAALMATYQQKVWMDQCDAPNEMIKLS